MDLHDQRMQCLKMAFELGGKPEAILTAAQQLLDFVTAPSQPDVAAAASPQIEQAPVSEPEAPTDAVPDPIAACGTALVMPEGGELADAIPTPDVSVIAVEPESAAIGTAVEAAPSDADSEAPLDSAAPSPSESATEQPEIAAAIEAADEASAEGVTIEETTTEIATEAAEATPATPSNVDGTGEATASLN